MPYHGGAPRVRRRANMQTGAEAQDQNTNEEREIIINTNKLLDVAVTAVVTAGTTALVNKAMNK